MWLQAWSSLTSLESHLEQRRHTALYRLNSAQLAGYLTAALPADYDVTEDLVLTVCGLLDTNSFEVRPIGSGDVCYHSSSHCIAMSPPLPAC